jgi:hypothetical protein
MSAPRDNGRARPSNQGGAHPNGTNFMREPIDAERLAMLLDGRLDERERERAELLAELADSDEALAAFADATAITRELEDEDAAAGVIPFRRPTRRPATPRPWHWAVAAAVAAAVLLTVLTSRRTSAPRGPTEVVALLSKGEAGPQLDSVPWTDNRSGETKPPAGVRAVRLGATLVDLGASIQARPRNVSKTEQLATDAGALVDHPQGEEALRQIEARPGAPAEELLPLVRRAELSMPGHERELRAGAWAEAGRLAAAARDEKFFREDDWKDALSDMAGLQELTQPGRDALERIRAASTGREIADWDTLRQDLADLLAALASER